MKTQSYEYNNHGIKQTVNRITLLEIPGVDLDRTHEETAPRTATIRSVDDWRKRDRMLRRINKGQDMIQHPPSWTADASIPEWGQQ